MVSGEVHIFLDKKLSTFDVLKANAIFNIEAELFEYCGETSWPTFSRDVVRNFYRLFVKL